MKALILAAGRGSRMEGLTKEIPKCLVTFKDKPLIEWQLDALRTAGIEDIGVITGYKAESLRSYHLTEFHNARWAETNMVSSLEHASQWLTSSPCIVSYSDIVYEASAISSLVECDAAMAITYDPNWLQLWEKRFGDPLLDAETFILNDDGSLAEIGNKPETVDEVMGQYMGLLKFDPSGWAEITRIRESLTDQIRDKDHMTGTLNRIINENQVPIFAIKYEQKWYDFDSQTDLDQINIYLQSEESR
jgi:choline kinase